MSERESQKPIGHTPGRLVWRKRLYDLGWILETENGKCIAAEGIDSAGTPDAERLCCAWNSHGDLLAACRFAVEAIGRQSKFWKDDPILARVTIDLEAAIAKAEGRTP